MKELKEKSTAQLEIERLQVREQLDLLYEAKAKAEDELTQYNNLLGEISDLGKKRDELNKKIDKEKKEFLALLEELSVKKDLSEKEIAKLASEIVGKQQEAKVLDDTINSLRAKGLLTMGQVDDLQKQLKNAEVQISQKEVLLKELEEVKSFKENAQAELNAKQKEVALLNQTLETLKSQITQTAVKKEEIESAVKSLLLDVKANKEVVKGLEEQAEKIVLSNEKLKSDYLDWELKEKEKIAKSEKDLSDRLADMSVKEAWFAKQVSLVKKYKAEAEKHFGTRFENLNI